MPNRQNSSLNNIQNELVPSLFAKFRAVSTYAGNWLNFIIHLFLPAKATQYNLTRNNNRA